MMWIDTYISTNVLLQQRLYTLFPHNLVPTFCSFNPILVLYYSSRYTTQLIKHGGGDASSSSS